jgi:hypothetical protein
VRQQHDAGGLGTELLTSCPLSFGGFASLKRFLDIYNVDCEHVYHCPVSDTHFVHFLYSLYTCMWHVAHGAYAFIHAYMIRSSQEDTNDRFNYAIEK